MLKPALERRMSPFDNIPFDYPARLVTLHSKLGTADVWIEADPEDDLDKIVEEIDNYFNMFGPK